MGVASAVQPHSGGVRGGEEGHAQECTCECCTYPLATYPLKKCPKQVPSEVRKQKRKMILGKINSH